ncbi:MAG: GNAT family N-acetyltransferase [Turicibacter sp.]
MKIIPIVESDRMILRYFEENDLTILYDYRNNRDCSKYQRWDDTSKEYLKNFIKEQSLKTLNDDSLQLAIADKQSNVLVGDIFIAFKEKCITIGYTIDAKYHRQGYAFEMIKELIRYLFDNFKDYEIVALVHPNNEPSKKLLEKLGFKNEGYVQKLDSEVYSLLN